MAISPWQQLNKWYQKPLGQHLLALEQQSLMTILNRLPDSFLLQLGGAPHFQPPLSRRRFYWSQLVPDPSLAEAGAQFVGALDALPVLPGSVDVILLPHSLEFVPRPYQVLEEAAASLHDGGYVIVFAFNPFSLWGLARMHSKVRHQWPWQGRFWSATRMTHWLSRLGMTIEVQTSLFYRPPLRHALSLKRWMALEAIGQMCWPHRGGSIMIVACKRKRARPKMPLREVIKAVPPAREVKPVPDQMRPLDEES